MDDRGMLPGDFCCTRCGKPLNADGNHPAELYLGTFNGLCYGCTAAGPYVVKVSLLDGARVLSYPPHCPSWRRDREEFTAYPDCGTCKGSGVQRSCVGQTGYREYCKPCIRRYSANHVRVLEAEWTVKIADAGNRAFQRRLTLAAGLRPGTSRKRQAAGWAALGEEVKDSLRRDLIPRCARLLARHKARIERLGGGPGEWRNFAPGEVAP
jgi:hypothetical protein